MGRSDGCRSGRSDISTGAADAGRVADHRRVEMHRASGGPKRKVPAKGGTLIDTQPIQVRDWHKCRCVRRPENPAWLPSSCTRPAQRRHPGAAEDHDRVSSIRACRRSCRRWSSCKLQACRTPPRCGRKASSER